MAALRYLVLDVETKNGRPEHAERFMRLAWSPDPRWKAETIGARYKEALEKKQERLALIDEAPIACVTLKSDAGLCCYHVLCEHPPKSMHGGTVVGFASQVEMLGRLRELLDGWVDPATTSIAGHNLFGFDLRKLRWAYVRHGLRMPTCLAQTGQTFFDTMREFAHRFSLNKEVMISLDDLLEEFGVENHKGEVSGEEVPKLIEAGQFDTVIGYSMLDVLAEEQLFLRMTGQLDDAGVPTQQPETTAAPAPVVVESKDPPAQPKAPAAAPGFVRETVIADLRTRAKEAPYVRTAAQELGLTRKPLDKCSDDELQTLEAKARAMEEEALAAADYGDAPAVSEPTKPAPRQGVPVGNGNGTKVEIAF